MENINTTKLFKSLEELYIESKYDDIYQIILESKDSFDPAVFHYNLGTVYARGEEYGIARYHLEKSIKLGMLNKKTLNNLDYVKSKIYFQDIGHSTLIKERVINLGTVLPVDLYISLSLLFVIAGIILLKVKRKISYRPALLWMLLCLSPLVSYQYYFKKQSVGIVLKESIVNEGPSEIYKTVISLPAGSKIIVGENYNGWYFIKSPSSISGWLKKNNLGFY